MVMPVSNAVRLSAEVISNCSVIPGANLIWLEAPVLALKARPGQFAMLSCGGQTFLRRPFSIHRISKNKTRVSFLYGMVGKGTLWLSELKPGSILDLIAPLGNTFELDGTGPAVLIAGGLGIAPLIFLADELRQRGRETTFLYGAASSNLLYQKCLTDFDDVVLVTEDGSAGREGMVTGCLPEFLKVNSEVFACGPAPMLKALGGMVKLTELKTQMSLEVRMACGFGVCYGCSINTVVGMRQVCKHGPVFYLRDIVWDEFASI
jgi:dihydroorotate dehydrogenase electron transfer subunit